MKQAMLVPQFSCVLAHWRKRLGNKQLATADVTVLNDTALAVYVAKYGIERLRTTITDCMLGRGQLESGFLVIGPGLVQGVLVRAWLERWLTDGNRSLQMSSLYGAIFLSDGGEGMGLLVERMLRKELAEDLLEGAKEAAGIIRDARAGRCSMCGRVAVTREDLPSTLTRDRL
jgi:hypothetical protein